MGKLSFHLMFQRVWNLLARALESLCHDYTELKEDKWKMSFVGYCHGLCLVMLFLKKNQRMALTEPPMMAVSPIDQYQPLPLANLIRPLLDLHQNSPLIPLPSPNIIPVMVHAQSCSFRRTIIGRL